MIMEGGIELEFQSLLCWIGPFKRRIAPCSQRASVVSILVVLDRSLQEAVAFPPVPDVGSVSILVVLDRSLQGVTREDSMTEPI